jgi:hypothetical protein
VVLAAPTHDLLVVSGTLSAAVSRIEAKRSCGAAHGIGRTMHKASGSTRLRKHITHNTVLTYGIRGQMCNSLPFSLGYCHGIYLRRYPYVTKQHPMLQLDPFQ